MTITNRLRNFLSPSQFIVDSELQKPFLTDWRGRYHGSAQAVVFPTTIEQVSEVVRLCMEMHVPIVPQGGNTGLCGGATPSDTGKAVVVSMTRLNKIREIDAQNFSITAEAGVTLDELKTAAEAENRLYPLTLGAGHLTTLGGTLATNAGGLQVLRYGMTRDLCLGLEVVLPDGRVWSKLNGLRKDNTGYDLKHWFIGSEGTLGLITAATMKLYPLPKAKAIIWLDLLDPEAAVRHQALAQSVFGGAQTAAEVISASTLNLVRKHMPEIILPQGAGDWPKQWALMLEVSANDSDFINVLLKSWQKSCEADGLSVGYIARTQVDQNIFWSIRKGLAESQKREGLSIKHDIGLPISKIPYFLEKASDQLNQQFPELRIVAFGHIGDGNLHFNLSYPDPIRNQDFLNNSVIANQIVYELVDALGGSIAAEHGIGQLKPAWLEKFAPAQSIHLMHQLKSMLDPDGLMNPGKILM